eukprot:Anaeramoba_ignava/a608258_93.p1 GENE.a608258_93~~a608258_93.p1  ORF type:complete len:546 (+),score=81.62 a608258_93:58-1695(+)
MKRFKKGKQKDVKFKTVQEVVKRLIKEYDEGETIDFELIKKECAKATNFPGVLKSAEIIAVIPESYKKSLLPIIKQKPVRTASGIAVVAIMCKPIRCPHIVKTGHICLYCPGGPDSDFDYSTQSYTGFEPTSMRAIRARYDPYVQTKDRLNQFQAIGHSISKVEFIVMGGTFMSMDTKYREWFIRNLHDALSGHNSSTLAESIRFSEQSTRKCVGLTIETRPDYCMRPHLNSMLEYGCTRLEIGVQTIFDDVLAFTNRGHDMNITRKSFYLSKEAGFKVIAHMMPNLPRVDLERDIECFRELFENPQYRVDGLKLYPTLVIRGTELYKMWTAKKYRTYDSQELIDLVAEIFMIVPPWTRIFRVQRDVPMPLVSSSAVEQANLREVALERVKEMGGECRDVRTREVGIKQIHHKINPEELELVRRDYVGNDGWETFLAYEDPLRDILVGLLRLRKCSPSNFRPELKNNSSMVRELHVYGSVVPVHGRDKGKFQHQGIGMLLMQEAERIARDEHGSQKISVISAIGTRHYYRKLGYELDGPYMSKNL